MKILTYPLGDLATNSYILINETTRDAIAIDIGANGNFLLLEGLKNNFTIKAILLTHGHFDHIGGVGELYAKGIDVYIGENEVDFIKDDSLNLSSYFGERVKQFDAKPVKDGEILNLCGFEIQAILTPGHTKGSVTYKIGENLFCGDVLFDGSFGRVDFPTGNAKELVKSAKKLFEYKNHTLYSGHGNKTTTDKEKETNPIRYYD
jgi:glyoxylase-like metal-dependent hydrolase (beta-lactamase superfamily II)